MPSSCVEVETPNADQSPRDPHDLQSVLASCFPITLKFMDVCYKVKLDNKSRTTNITRMLTTGPTTSTTTITERTILNGITGMVSPGEILAVLGPSGSGKSTLLNALAGRLQGHCFTGTILANGKKPTKPVQKRTGFVAQDDVLYPHLTVRETLVFCSLLRLPKTLSTKEKTSVVESLRARDIGRGEEAGEHSARDADEPEPADTGRANVGSGRDGGIPAGGDAGEDGGGGAEDGGDVGAPAVEPGVPGVRLGAGVVGREVYLLWERE
ncbi:hypothetical protein RHSIM_Rhsim06G0094300 [Rhododendron simsii]|uniref:ABC transporter domain-containing protein n=1 Tax=Rhododendron simsii TaxID=118357 RepID=A0A834GUI1_RHOSS|nr:hypothetical protein RHSIM_Rhsim06G0094300 [Rhododendron simsii]